MLYTVQLTMTTFSVLLLLIYSFIHSFILVLSLDAMDSAGEHHLHIDHNIYKRRLDLLGQPLEEPQKEGESPNKNLAKIC